MPLSPVLTLRVLTRWTESYVRLSSSMKLGFLSTYPSSFFFGSKGSRNVAIGFVSAKLHGLPNYFLALVY